MVSHWAGGLMVWWWCGVMLLGILFSGTDGGLVSFGALSCVALL